MIIANVVPLLPSPGMPDTLLLEVSAAELGNQNSHYGAGQVVRVIPPGETACPEIVDRCPSCGGRTLFIGSGGYLTCSLLGCKEPGVTAAVEQLKDELRRAHADLVSGGAPIMCRPSVARFAVAMETKLRKHDETRKHWRGMSIEFLAFRLVDEVGELARAVLGREGELPVEAVDAGNMSMMVFDKALGCADGDPRDIRDLKLIKEVMPNARKSDHASDQPRGRDALTGAAHPPNAESVPPRCTAEETHPRPHNCLRAAGHVGAHRCSCGTEWHADPK